MIKTGLETQVGSLLNCLRLLETQGHKEYTSNRLKLPKTFETLDG